VPENGIISMRATSRTLALVRSGHGKIFGDPEAARMAAPQCRSPWKYPKQYLACEGVRPDPYADLPLFTAYARCSEYKNNPKK
jgi:hypothetical protein